MGQKGAIGNFTGALVLKLEAHDMPSRARSSNFLESKSLKEVHEPHESVARRVWGHRIGLDNPRASASSESNGLLKKLVTNSLCPMRPLYEEASKRPNSFRVIGVVVRAAEPPIRWPRSYRAPGQRTVIAICKDAYWDPGCDPRTKRCTSALSVSVLGFN